MSFVDIFSMCVSERNCLACLTSLHHTPQIKSLLCEHLALQARAVSATWALGHIFPRLATLARPGCAGCCELMDGQPRVWAPAPHSGLLVRHMISAARTAPPRLLQMSTEDGGWGWGNGFAMLLLAVPKIFYWATA
jgi:hypothetical protein